jgi:hypothetical protein
MDLNPTLVVGIAEFDAQTEYNSGATGVGQVPDVQPCSSNVMKSAALLVVNTTLLKILGITRFSHALPTDTSSQS